MDGELLLKVTEFDFDLSDDGFLFYAEQRGVLWYAGAEGSRRREFVGNVALGREDFVADPYFQFAETAPECGEPHRYDEKELETAWRVICYTRARLQDAWELYKEDVDIMRRWVRPGIEAAPFGPPPPKTYAERRAAVRAEAGEAGLGPEIETTAAGEAPTKPPKKTASKPKKPRINEAQVDLFEAVDSVLWP